MNKIVKEKKIVITPIITEHWEKKFEKSIPILLKSGYELNYLINRIKEIFEHENNNPSD